MPSISPTTPITSTPVVYQDDYFGINRCNQVLDNVPNIDMDATLKTQYLGEAKFMRGFFYFNLATNYGNVAIMLHTSKITDYPSTSPQDSVFAQAEQDFTDATTMLPNSYDAANVGRATAGRRLCHARQVLYAATQIRTGPNRPRLARHRSRQEHLFPRPPIIARILSSPRRIIANPSSNGRTHSSSRQP